MVWGLGLRSRLLVAAGAALLIGAHAPAKAADLVAGRSNYCFRHVAGVGVDARMSALRPKADNRCVMSPIRMRRLTKAI
jgi:diacylglycerol kinase family enzyme